MILCDLKAKMRRGDLLPEGCAYRKPDEPPVAPEALDAVVRDILWRQPAATIAPGAPTP